VIVIRSIFHNLFVTAVGAVVAFVGAGLDRLVGIDEFRATPTIVVGAIFVLVGFFIRFWATCYFYKNQMRVMATAPQQRLLTAGPYHYSRNPLYLGGNVFIFFGASVVLGSPMAILITAIHLPFVDRFIRWEERQLAALR
jgi:protein-S-isoprenylcysteine O-methyltransferase Ste14